MQGSPEWQGTVWTMITDLHGLLFDVERVPIALGAMVLVAVFGLIAGPIFGTVNPILWKIVEGLFGTLGAKMDKPTRTARDLAMRGLLLVFFALIIGFLLAKAVMLLVLFFPFGQVVDLLALTLVLTAGCVWRALWRLYRAVEGKGTTIKGAFLTISQSTRTNLAVSDEYTITRVGLGMGARLFDKGLFAPILWYLIAGLGAAYLYAVLAALSWRFGKDGFGKGFGTPALALERLLGFVPNMVAGIYVALAGLMTPTAGMTRALAALLPFRAGQCPYEQGGAPLTALAFALNVNLGGAVQDVDGSALQRAWVGPPSATARLEAAHLKRGLYILVMAYLLLMASLLVMTVMPQFLWVD